MCGIAGIINLKNKKIPNISRNLEVMNDLQIHRGPDDCGKWIHEKEFIGFAHRRLSIIDIVKGKQPMKSNSGNWITFNGEIYNYIELQDELKKYEFKTHSDTEVILNSFEKWGFDCLNHFRGMFSFALWDKKSDTLFCARDRFGIKPFYYTIVDNKFVFSSEVKALLPFVKNIETDLEGLKDYLTFQFCLAGKTLFKGIYELLPGHYLTIRNGNIKKQRYWQVYFNLDFNHTQKYFEDKIESLFNESISLHKRSDVPIGAYISGGLDSSIIASIASYESPDDFLGFTGKFSDYNDFDESNYAETIAKSGKFQLYQIDIKASDFINNIQKIIYHLDYPVAGPGSFPQFMVSNLASHYRKVVLGGQGGDEIFGGYARYIIAYFEQCINGAIEGSLNNGNFIVTYESIIPNLQTLKKYKPLLKEFWKEGLFSSMDKRYFRLINRANFIDDEVNWEILKGYSPFETFLSIFRADNVQKESYFDSMTHFDFKTLLPSLLQVEDRVSMAHGLESRVPILDHPIVELAATIPSNIKFENGTLKNILRKSMGHYLPEIILNRRDKMGFPVPLVQWFKKDIKDYILDIFSSKKANSRNLINNRIVKKSLEKEPEFGRKIWGLLCLELWQKEFHDKRMIYKNMIKMEK